jgi:hypothetical protein
MSARQGAPAKERPYPCTFEGCTYAAQTTGNLRVHLLAKHSSGPLFPCTVAGCAYAAKNATYLRVHARAMHGIGKNIPICPHEGCGFRGATPRTFEEHVNAHSGVRPHRCPTCATFSTAYKSHLSTHVKNCTGVQKSLQKSHPPEPDEPGAGADMGGNI